MSIFKSVVQGATDFTSTATGSSSTGSGGITSTTSSTFSSINSILPGGVTGEENDSLFPSMSYQNRLYGFIGCFAFGWILTIFSTVALWTGNITGFVTLYTIGNVTALFGSGFLVGPYRQCRLMWKPVRAVATGVYLASLIATICVAVLTGNGLITLICVIIQFLAAVWYSASYIPFARQAIVNVCQSTFGITIPAS